jgi:DNA polymerase III sliding clamp (beta) subunit (PCNA family)
MKINKTELQKALEKVKPGLSNKELVEQSTSFAFMNGRIVTYNDEISISHPVKDLNVTGAVKAQSLYAFLGKIKRDEIIMEWEENQVVIKAGKAKAGLVLEQEIKLPIEEVGAIGKWHKLPAEVLEGLKFCYPCCSKDMSRPILTCVYVNSKDVQASDSFQIVQYRLEKKLPIKSFLLPASAAHELVKYKVKEVAEGNGWRHFKTEEGTVFSSRVFEGEFPDITKFLEFKGTEVVFPKKIIQALDRAQVFSKNNEITGNMATIEVEISGNEIRLSSKNEAGWFEETIKHTHKGDKIKFITGAEFLIKLLTNSPSCIYGKNKIKFTGGNWIHVIAVSVNED